MRTKPSKRESEPTHQEVMDKKGITVRALMIATGLSDEGIRKCLRKNRLPVNPLVRDAYLAALGLTEQDAARQFIAERESERSDRRSI